MTEYRVSSEDAETCRSCENTYAVVLIKESDDWNDFGYRHCPFCGNMTDQHLEIRKKLKERRRR